MIDLHPIPDQSVKEAEAEVLARKVRELIFANDPEELIIAAKVVTQLPRLGVEGDQLVETEALSEEIARHIGRIGIR